MIQGEKSKILGTIGDFEIGARWQWKVQLHTISVCLLAVSVALLLFLAAGCIHLGRQFAELSRARLEIQLTKDEVSKLHSALQEEVSWIRDKLDVLDEMLLLEAVSADQQSNMTDNYPGNSIRDRRSISKAAAGKASKITGVHLERDIDFYHTGSTGDFVRWQPQPWSPPFAEAVQLESENSTLVIQTTGLYFVYAQLCYASTNKSNSFEVRLMSQGVRSHAQSKVIAQCNSGTSTLGNDVTCYTSTVQVLQAGDRLFLLQMQKDRYVMMSNGRSFWGAIKLAKAAE